MNNKTRSKKCFYKVSLLFPINEFPKKKDFKKLAHIYYNKCFLWRNLCSVWKKKQPNIGFPYLQIYDWPVKYYFLIISVYVNLGCYKKFSSLYILQGYYFTSTLLLWSIDEYDFFYFEQKSTFKNVSLLYMAIYKLLNISEINQTLLQTSFLRILFTLCLLRKYLYKSFLVPL